MHKENWVTSILARPSNVSSWIMHTYLIVFPDAKLISKISRCRHSSKVYPWSWISLRHWISLGSFHPTLISCEKGLKSPVFIFLRHLPLDRCNHCYLLFPGPTVLEVFNTLLKHLRISVDLELGDRRSSAGSATLSTSSKESDERIVQNAIIQTIGE